MVPAALVIIAAVVVAAFFWIEDRRELRRVKRDLARLRERVQRLENVVASQPAGDA